MATKTEYVVVDSTQPSLVLSASRIRLIPGSSYQFSALFTGTPSITYGTKFPKYFKFDTTTYIVSCKELGDLPISSGYDSAWCYFNLTLLNGNTYRAEIEVVCDCDASEVITYDPIVHNYEKVVTPYIDDEFINGFYDFVKQREPLAYLSDDGDWWVYDECKTKAYILLEPLLVYIYSSLQKRVLYYAMLHYYIVEPFEYGDDSSINPLYAKYDIIKQEGGMIINSASDESSSASIESFKSLQDADFWTTDLMRTPYGRYVYSILESLSGVAPVLL